MRTFFYTLILFFVTSGYAQFEVKPLYHDSSIVWQKDRFFVFESVIDVKESDKFSFVDHSTDSNFVKLSVNNLFVSNGFELNKGTHMIRLWLRADAAQKNIVIPFEINSSMMNYSDTLIAKMDTPKKDYINFQQVTNWLDFYSNRKENIEVQLYDSLWNLIGTLDLKRDRIDIKKLDYGRYFFKTSNQLYAFDKIDPENFIPAQKETTIYHSTIQ